ncbi:MAG: sensor histidine kinase [Faecousia sp.]
MTKRIFTAIVLVTVVILLLSSALISVVLYEDLETQFFNELKSEAHTIAVALESGLPAEGYLPALEPARVTDLRVTWVAANGDVLYDSDADETTMENHLAREEIAEALQNGYGDSTRNSATISKKTIYYACRLSDGTVLRVSGTQDSVFGILFNILKPMAWVLLAAVGLALVLSYRVSKRVVRPLNELDLEHPQKVETYDELTPLLEKISAQNRQIRAQMEQLRRSQEEFAAVTGHMSEGLLVIDAKMRLLFCNEAAKRLLHIGQAETQSLLTVNRSAPFREAAEEALQGKHAQESVTLDGRIYQLMANPAYDGQTLTGAVLLLLDVTEREDRERLRREFTANVSHELRTPLTSISGFAELIREGLAKQEDIPRFADRICKESQRLLALIEDILRLSQLDEGGTTEEKTPQKLDELACAVVQQLTPVAQEKGISITVDTAPCEVPGVRRVLEELIYNLCDNAVKYNRPKGTVKVTAKPVDGVPTLIVADTGIGIPEAEQERVFERFYRVDKSHSKAIGGTGLGLSIVKHAAAFHNAEITMQSELGKGTEIRLRFPK